jgi:hypothetical protein
MVGSRTVMNLAALFAARARKPKPEVKQEEAAPAGA